MFHRLDFSSVVEDNEMKRLYAICSSHPDGGDSEKPHTLLKVTFKYLSLASTLALEARGTSC